MIKNFVKISLKDSTKGQIEETIQTRKSIVLNYPCSNTYDCTPYVLEVSKGVYKFESWGSKGMGYCYSNSVCSRPGLGGYTSGKLFLDKHTRFYLYIGTQGFYNAVKDLKVDIVKGSLPGGATDVRMNYSDNWWDSYSLISRIMVSAGGGGTEWSASIGGNGGGLIGGESISAKNYLGSEVYEDHCPGATQTSGSKCPEFDHSNSEIHAFKGEFGSGGLANPINGDFCAFGGGGYYGGTSYEYSFAGSGGSSFISGHEGCKSVKEQTEVIEHTNTSYHYSGFVFTNTEMISGNETMPLPTSSTEEGIYDGSGAFRITLLLYSYQCTYKKSLYSSLIPNLFIFIYLPLNRT